MKKLIDFTDSLARVQNITPDSVILYAELADSIIRMRFYHGLQNYRFADNYLANLAGKYFWSHFGAKVKPNHILKGQKAFCSQSSIVFQELLKSKGFKVRAVRLPGHFCTEVQLNGNWSFYDVSFKPIFKQSPPLSTSELSKNLHYLKEAYLYTFSDNFANNLHNNFTQAKISYGPVNAFAAPNMRWFHRITWFLSWWGWVVFLGAAVVVRRVWG
jgi:hypothetical protein